MAADRWMSARREAFLRAQLAAHGVLQPSLCGLRCADFLAVWMGGLYRFPSAPGIGRTVWTDRFVRFRMPVERLCSSGEGGLTRFVFLCHDLSIRGEIQPHSERTVAIELHPCERRQGHPTLAVAVADWRSKERSEAKC